MKASVIICTLNRAKLLVDAVRAISRQRSPIGGFEVIVVDNNSSDSTRAVTFQLAAGSCVPVRYIFEKKLGLSFARNAGIAAAAGQIVAFVDDDIDAGPDWLCSILAPFDDPRVACAGGPIRPIWSAVKPDWLTKEWQGYLGITEFDVVRETGEFHEPNYPWGGNMAFRKNIFEVAGVFPTDLGRIGTGLLCNEEISVCKRIEAVGEKICFAPDAVIFHKIPPERLTKQYFYHRTFYQGRSNAILDLRSVNFDYSKIRDFASSLFWQNLLQQGSLFDRKCRERLFIGYLSRAFAAADEGAGSYRPLRALKTALLTTFKTAAAAVTEKNEHFLKIESLVRERDEWLAGRDEKIAELQRQVSELQRQVSEYISSIAELRQTWWVRFGVRLGLIDGPRLRPTEHISSITPQSRGV